MTRLEKGTLYNEDMRGITTSSPVFEHLIQHNLTYVDKTKYIHSLVSSTQSSFYFVSRPRRWGKSLFCYTLESLFKGARIYSKAFTSTISVISNPTLCFISISTILI